MPRNVKFLNLSHNKFKDKLSSSFLTSFSNLEVLDLSFNYLTSLDIQPQTQTPNQTNCSWNIIPNLKQLYVQGNLITSISRDTLNNLLINTNIQNIEHEWAYVINSLLKKIK
jgi:Leucine-rich repeat (LRR) protein